MTQLKQLLCGILCAALLAGCASAPTSAADASRPDFTSVPTAGQPEQADAQQQMVLSYRAMWFGYPDWPVLDTSTPAAFTASVGTVLDNCLSLGLNRIIVHVRPFGDAVYPSDLFPWSHLLTGTQGQDPGYDPLEIFVQEAHARGLAFEAWINPYRLALSDSTPGALADTGLSSLHPDWVKQAAGGLYLDPSNPDVQAYIVAGVEEILDRYDVDGIQFDDYFYPTTDESFDAQEYAAANTDLPLAQWRRQNVNDLVQSVYSAIHAKRADVTFGISPQGNNDNNYNGQYSDVALWLSTPGYVDYVMPQVYWGYQYTQQNGSARFGFANIVNEWSSLPRSPQVALNFGLGAYRIGAGDGSATPGDEWSSGENLAAMVKTLADTQADGYALYCYRYLFANGEYAALAEAECTALAAANAET